MAKHHWGLPRRARPSSDAFPDALRVELNKYEKSKSDTKLMELEMMIAFPAMSSAIDELGITGLHGASGGANAAAAPVAAQTGYTSPSNDIQMEG